MNLSMLNAAVDCLERWRCVAPPGVAARALARLQEMLADCAKLLDCSGASIWLKRAGGRMHCLLALDGAHRRLKDFHLEPGEGLTGICSMTGRPFALDNASLDQRHSSRVDQLVGTRTRQLLACPLLVHGELIGVLNILNRCAGGDPTFHDAEILAGRLLAGEIAAFLVQSELWTAKRGAGAKGASAGDSAEDEPNQPVAVSHSMQEILARIRSSHDRPLLLTGETGVGKDLLANWAHRISPRATHAFVPINCAAIQEELWESEIFGHARGAFTGAGGDKPGQIEGADGGTLFLNEIGEMPERVQAKLLTFLDDGRFQRVGEVRMRTVRTRVIAATNRDLRRDIERGRFRRDLYFRLAAVHLNIPPLRERPADVLALTMILLERFAREARCETPWLCDSARERLHAKRWEGNVRELSIAVQTAFWRCIESGSTSLLPEHFDPDGDQAGTAETAASFAGAEHPPDASGPWLERMLTTLARIQPSAAETAGVRAGGPAAGPATAAIAPPPNDLWREPGALKAYLESFHFASSKGWNLSEAHRRLVAEGRTRLSRRAFARRVNLMFPDQ